MEEHKEYEIVAVAAMHSHWCPCCGEYYSCLDAACSGINHVYCHTCIVHENICYSWSQQ